MLPVALCFRCSRRTKLKLLRLWIRPPISNNVPFRNFKKCDCAFSTIVAWKKANDKIARETNPSKTDNTSNCRKQQLTWNFRFAQSWQPLLKARREKCISANYRNEWARCSSLSGLQRRRLHFNLKQQIAKTKSHTKTWWRHGEASGVLWKAP